MPECSSVCSVFDGKTLFFCGFSAELTSVLTSETSVNQIIYKYLKTLTGYTNRLQMSIRLRKFSFRFAEQVLNSKLTLKQEIEDTLTDPTFDLKNLSRDEFNRLIGNKFVLKGWQNQPPIFDEPSDPSAKMDFLKDRIGVEVAFTHPSFIGIDLLKFQVASYSGLDKIDVGVYIVTTNNFQKTMVKDYKQNWKGSLSFEKVTKYLPHFKSAIQLPIYVLGIDI